MPGSQRTYGPGVCTGRNQWVLVSWCHRPMGAGESNGLPAPPAPHPTQREKAAFVFPKTGTGQAHTTLTHPRPQPCCV